MTARQQAAVRAEARADRTIAEIARAAGVDRHAARGAIRRLSLPYRQTRRRNATALVRSVADGTLTVREIAARTGLPLKSAQDVCYRGGVRFRDARRERPIDIGAAMALHAAGESPTRIARRLRVGYARLVDTLTRAWRDLGHDWRPRCRR